jgi:hypothetical protein
MQDGCFVKMIFCLTKGRLADLCVADKFKSEIFYSQEQSRTSFR